MAEIGVPHGRHGRQAPQWSGTWSCKRCGAEQTTRPELGCTSCGAGVPTAAPPTGPRDVVAEVDLVRMQQEALTPELTEALTPEAAGWYFLFGFLTPRARVTIAQALLSHAEHGTPSNTEFSRVQILAWARRLAAQLDDDERVTTTHGSSATPSTRGAGSARTAGGPGRSSPPNDDDAGTPGFAAAGQLGGPPAIPERDAARLLYPDGIYPGDDDLGG